MVCDVTQPDALGSAARRPSSSSRSTGQPTDFDALFAARSGSPGALDGVQGLANMPLEHEPRRARTAGSGAFAAMSVSAQGPTYEGRHCADWSRPDWPGHRTTRRVGKHVLVADMRAENGDAAAKVLSDAGYEVSVAAVDVSARETVHALVESATRIGDLAGVIHSAGVSPSQASPQTVLKTDLYGTALVLEEFGSAIARGGSGVVISSQSGHRLPALTIEQDKALATTPVEQLLSLPFVQPDQIRDSLHAYQLSKRGNSLRVMAEAVRWGQA